MVMSRPRKGAYLACKQVLLDLQVGQLQCRQHFTGKVAMLSVDRPVDKEDGSSRKKQGRMSSASLFFSAASAFGRLDYPF